MAQAIPSYELTEAGRKAWQSHDTAIPKSFRLLLWLIDYHGDDYFEDLTRRYPSPALWGLLGELEDLGFIKRLTTTARKRGLSAAALAKAFSANEQRGFEQELQQASQSVLRGKAYVPELRRKRSRPAKPATETTVLIVEDDPDQLALADLRVSTGGYQVWVAESAGALKETLATRGLPDVVVLDVMLPDGDGFEILRSLRADPVYRDLPVILLTAKTDLDDILAGLKLGADGYLTKPYAKAALNEMLRTVLGEPGT